MPNAIKYSTSTQTLALKKGNYWIGTGDVGKGPTNITEYWNGITPPAGGYVIYGNKGANGPSIYIAQDDSELINITQVLSGTLYASAKQALNWYFSQSDIMVFNRDYEPILTDGLVLNLDAGFAPSYPETGNRARDISSTATDALLYVTSHSDGGFIFNGSSDYIDVTNVEQFGITQSITVEAWIRLDSLSNSTDPCIINRYTNTAEGWMLFLSTNNYVGEGDGNTGPNTLEFGWVATGTGRFKFAVVGTGETVVAGDWYQVVGVFNHVNNTNSIYVNGVLKRSNNRVGQGTELFDTNNDIKIGKYNTGSFFQGQFAVSRVYNKALNSNEILANFNAQKDRFGL